MRSRIIYTVGGMATNARHRRDVEPAYRTGEDAPSQARYLAGLMPLNYAAMWAKHRAEVAA